MVVSFKARDYLSRDVLTMLIRALLEGDGPYPPSFYVSIIRDSDYKVAGIGLLPYFRRRGLLKCGCFI